MDDIEGVWRSHQHHVPDRQWSSFTLTIRHDKGEALTGTIHNDLWKGGPEKEQPGRCGADSDYRVHVSMKATGSVTDGKITFRGTSWKLDEVVCGTLSPSWGYNLDAFTGALNTELMEFQSVNNDGGRMVNHPTVFRRIRCLGDAPPKKLKVKPPPIFPERRSDCACTVVGAP